MGEASVRRLVRALAFGIVLGVARLASADPVAEGARADRTDATPAQLAGVDVREHLGQKMPLDLALRDEQGRPVRLGDFFDGRRPLLLTLNYSDCPMLCSLLLTGLVNGMKQIEWSVGQEFQVVTLSLDPSEPTATTQRTKQRYARQYARPSAAAGWHFLTGTQEAVKAYADALGFSFRYDEKRKEYAHPAAVALVSPSGNITRYLYGIEFKPQTLRLAFVEASEGRIGSTIDKIILYCFHYDSSEGRYAPIAARIMQVGGAVAVAIIGGALFLLHRSDRRRKRRLAESTAT